MAAIAAATAAYEAWMRRRIDIVERDLRLKHQRMAAAPFMFLRATFYRWVPLWQEVCPELARTPKLLAVGDLHVENFGTWRDAEGRLCWGVNDFDEAFAMPYAIDLVRLATSALLAVRHEKLRLSGEEVCAALLAGYSETIAAEGGRPFVLEEEHPALRAMAMGAERDPVHFWAKLGAARTAEAPRPVRKLLHQAMPESDAEPRIAHRVAGLGSLGRPRFVALGVAQGGMVAREAKAMLPSAFAWASGIKTNDYFCGDLADAAIRSPDPFYRPRKGWMLRRLGPHCSAIELGDLPKRRDHRVILKAMGRETANVHWGSPEALGPVRRDLKRRGKRWLHEAAARMAEATLAEWRAWRRVHS
jgi:Uncharacterized protein conserved in bacteria (DUF2252)